MLIYNITIKVDWLIHDEWLPWLYNNYLLYAMSSSCFEQYRLVRLLETDDTEGPTYAVQLFAKTRADYDQYIEFYLPQLEEQRFEKWNGSMLTYTTLMEVVARKPM